MKQTPMAVISIPSRNHDGHKIEGFSGSLEVVGETNRGLVCRTGENDSPTTEHFAFQWIRDTFTKLTKLPVITP